MWHDTRRGFNLIRKRANDRKRRKIELTIIGVGLVIVSVFMIYGTYKIVEEGIDIAELEKNAIKVYSDDVELYNDDKKDLLQASTNISNKENSDEEIENSKDNEGSINIVALGDIMMGRTGKKKLR